MREEQRREKGIAAPPGAARHDEAPGEVSIRFLRGFDKERDIQDMGAHVHAPYSGRFTAAMDATGSINDGIGILRAILNRSQK